MGEDHVAAIGFGLGTLGLHDRGKPREAAAAPPVRHRLVAHQVDVVDQDERDLGLRHRGRRAGLLGDGAAAGEQRNQDQEGGKAAGQGHGGLFRCGWTHDPEKWVPVFGKDHAQHGSLACMQYGSLSRMCGRMIEVSPIDPANATEVTAAPAAAIGVLLVNLGTPDAADAPAVRRYLKEFLSDPRVIVNQGMIWQAVLNGIILPIRPRIKAKDYQKIWNVEGNESPLKTITRAQAEKLAAPLASLRVPTVVDWAMRYGNPSIESRLASLIARGCERILVMPLYPQYSAATTATVCDEVFRVLMGLRRQPALRVAAPSYDDRG